MSYSQLIRKLPEIVPKSAPWVEALIVAGIKYGIVNDKRILAHWLGQMIVETGMFTAFRESMNYDPAGLMRTFKGRITQEQANALGRIPGRAAKQQEIANIVYGGAWGKKNLGNTQPNDGWYFRGGGPKQTTGRKNTKLASIAIFGDDTLMHNPDLLATPAVGALASAVYWRDQRPRGIDAAALRNDYREVRRLVNGGSNGLEDNGKTLGTRTWTQRIEKLFNI